MTDHDASVVIVATEEDLTADMVAAHLLGGPVALLRLDPGRLRERPLVTGRFAGGRWHTVLASGRATVTLDERCAVYWRKPTRPDTLATAEERWRADENTTALLGLLRAHPLKVWIDDPTVVAASLHKPTQLATAARNGFAVPDTLFTSDPHAARAFIATHRDKVVVKALTQRHTTFIPTTRIHLTDDLAGIAGTLHYLQALVEDRLFDARVTVVDDRVFAAAIRTDGALDWRAVPREAAEYRAIDPPAEIARACVEHVRDLGLVYAALDFVVTSAGWTYLETNCVGEFGWIESATGLPISAQLARILSRGPARRRTILSCASGRM
ncbi:hypothetical protein ACFZBU_17130 [Embleya sp. NPDC008237]|uniref:hypothetical protein n=1 Tax=Embleya sp. NPDC008237 TaxID=3363978 RepID=UPI0036E2F503